MWSASVPLGGPGVRAPALAALPKVAVHAITGDAIAVWILRTGTIDSVWASRFHRVSGTWAGAVLLETDDRGHASQPEVAIDARGDAVAVWRQHDGTNYDIWANRFLASSGTWSGPVRLDASDLEARSPVVSAAGDGHAVVVWMQRSGIGSGYDIRAGRFNPTAGTWGLPSLLDAADVTADSPQVAIDSAGNAIAIWSQLMGSWYELMAARHPAN
jgi:hypothetical protein